MTMRMWRCPSVQFDLQSIDERIPFDQIVADDFAVWSRRHAARVDCRAAELLAHFGCRQGDANRVVQQVDHRLGRTGAGQQSVPAMDVEIGIALFGNGGYVGQEGDASPRRGRQCAQLAGADLG